ncbi:MAG: undecaprenyl-diphosphate phosphatase, partial [Clostridia bacterium]|nr:undecaprenyl-diphosphate phosphatase [Clostridia bacterium]
VIWIIFIPAILGACVTELPDLFSEGMSIDMLLPILVGAAVAAIVGFFAIKLLQYISKNKGFAVFSVYCVIIGVAAIVADIALS